MKISTEIKKVALGSAIDIKELSDEQVKKLKMICFRKYIQLQFGVFLWDSFKESAIVADSNG